MTFEARAPDNITSASGSLADTELPGGGHLPVLAVMHGEASSAGRIGQVLNQRGHALDFCKPRFGEPLPKTLARYAGVVVFGGPMSANDADDYIKAEIDFVGVALKEEKPFLGVCLGAQILAKHLGAKVGKHPGGKVEIGYHAIWPTAAGARLGAWPEHVYQWHREGFELPAGGTQLAQGDAYENQAFCYGRSGLGLQFHPEITYTLINRWTVSAKDWSDRDGAQERSAQLQSHLLRAGAVCHWFGGVVDAWLAGRVLATAAR